MKKIVLVLAFTAMGMVTLSSCTREHTCECVTYDSNGNETSSNKTAVTGTQAKAEEECDKKDSDPLLGPRTDCEIVPSF